jgi:hypothetical protein
MGVELRGAVQRRIECFSDGSRVRLSAVESGRVVWSPKKPSMGDGPSFGAAQSFEAHCVRTSG